MNKTIFFILLLLCPTMCRAQRIKAENAVIDVGQVVYDRPATATFVLKNTGKRPVSIDRVDTGCACSVANYPSSPVAAGDKFNISITYDARQMGHFDKIIEVYAATTTSPVVLEMTGLVVEELDAHFGNYPFRLGDLNADCNAVSFDDVYQGEVLTERFHIYNPGRQVVNPCIMHLPPYLTAEITPSTVLPNRSAVVTLTLDSRSVRDYGYTPTRVYLGANPGERVAADKQIAVDITLLPATGEMNREQLTAAPQLLMSAATVEMPVADGKKRTKTVDVQNTGHTPLEIYSMRMMTEGIEVSLGKRRLAPGETTKMKIKTDPKVLRGTTRMPRIVLITNDPQHPKATVDIDIN